MSSLDTLVTAACALIAATPAQMDRRKVIGIAGPPGSGKSTLAEHVVDRLNAAVPAQAALMPMDGYHLDNATLDVRGQRAIKGAPITFDAAGFVAKVAQAATRDALVRFALFDRGADCTRPDAGMITPATQIVIVEGNYLLLADAPWRHLADHLAATILLAPPLAVLERRLMARWTGLGLTEQEAAAKTQGNDLPNARKVLADSRPADLVLGQEAVA